MKKQSQNLQVYLANFKEMPFLLKLLFIGSVVTLISQLVDMFQLKPIKFEYFHSGFPKNFPIVWYAYSVLMQVVTMMVYLRRSYGLLKKYTNFTVGLLAIHFLHVVYLFINLPAEQRASSIVTYIIIYFFVALLVIYPLKQKKYFNKV
jgi:tryptophan-rich sensory protein